MERELPEVLKLAAQDKSLAESFDEETGAIAAEVVFSFQQEMAETLADCLLRRTMVGLNSSVGIGADERAAAIATEYLGWSETRAEEEVAAYRQYVKRFHPRAMRIRKSRSIILHCFAYQSLYGFAFPSAVRLCLTVDAQCDSRLRLCDSTEALASKSHSSVHGKAEPYLQGGRQSHKKAQVEKNFLTWKLASLSFLPSPVRLA